MLLTTLFCVIILPSICNAQQEDDISCFNMRDQSTWPKQVLSDLEACKADSGNQSNGQELTRQHQKIKKFLQKLWDKLITRVSKENRKLILECMWTRQKVFDVEGNEIDWNEVDAIIDSLQINEERKISLKAAVEDCIEDNDDDGKPRVKKLFKCFYKDKCFKAACPENLNRKRKLCQLKGYGGPKTKSQTTEVNYHTVSIAQPVTKQNTEAVTKPNTESEAVTKPNTEFEAVTKPNTESVPYPPLKTEPTQNVDYKDETEPPKDDDEGDKTGENEHSDGSK